MRELFPPGQPSPLCRLPHFSPHVVSSASPLGETHLGLSSAHTAAEHPQTAYPRSCAHLHGRLRGLRKMFASFLRRNTCGERCKYLVWFVLGFLVNILLQCHRCRWSYFVDAQHSGRQETTQSKYEAKQKHIELYLLWSCTDGENPSQRGYGGLHKSGKGAAQNRLLSYWNDILCRRYLMYHVLHAFTVILLIAPLPAVESSLTHMLRAPIKC